MQEKLEKHKLDGLLIHFQNICFNLTLFWRQKFLIFHQHIVLKLRHSDYHGSANPSKLSYADLTCF